jgi:DNA-binding Lrp family transcriptional regulator
MLEDLELKIIRSLNENSRKSFREIAKEIGTSAPVVINKIRKLEGSGAIKGYIPVLSPESFGYDLTAIISIRISHGKLIETQRKIAKDPRVYAVYDVTGDWDSIVCARFKNAQDLNGFIKNVLSHEHVNRTVTHLVLNVVKEERRVIV